MGMYIVTGKTSSISTYIKPDIIADQFNPWIAMSFGLFHLLFSILCAWTGNLLGEVMEYLLHLITPIVWLISLINIAQNIFIWMMIALQQVYYKVSMKIKFCKFYNKTRYMLVVIWNFCYRIDRHVMMRHMHQRSTIQLKNVIWILIKR